MTDNVIDFPRSKEFELKAPAVRELPATAVDAEIMLSLHALDGDAIVYGSKARLDTLYGVTERELARSHYMTLAKLCFVAGIVGFLLAYLVASLLVL